MREKQEKNTAKQDLAVSLVMLMSHPLTYIVEVVKLL